jgi:hypothetical protein
LAKEQAGLPLLPNLTLSNSMESSTKREGTIDLAYTTRKVVATVVNSDVFVDRMKKALGGESGAVAMITSVNDLVRM